MHRRTLIGLLAASATVAHTTAAVALGAIRSTTTIPGGQSFLLGGGQPGSFTVNGRNVGPVDVVIFAQKEDGTRIQVARVEPQQSVRYRFAERDMAVIENTSADRQAVVAFQINTRDTLGMRYRPPQS